MKKVVIVLSVVLILSSLLLGYVYILYNNQKCKNINLEQEIDVLTDNIESTNNINKTNELELENLKEENSQKISEYDLWKQMKEKVEAAL